MLPTFRERKVPRARARDCLHIHSGIGAGDDQCMRRLWCRCGPLVFFCILRVDLNLKLPRPCLQLLQNTPIAHSSQFAPYAWFLCFDLVCVVATQSKADQTATESFSAITTDSVPRSL